MAKAGAGHAPPTVANFYRCVISAVLIGLWAALSGQFHFHAEPLRWAAVFGGALLGPCLAMSLMFTSYRHWDLSKTSMVVMAEPLIVLPASLLLPGRSLTLQQVIGGLIILAGGFWLVWMHGRHRRRAALVAETDEIT
jgi:drug/metabolite transporter (DMT)-like permease